MAQLKCGILEIRTAQTAPMLEEWYAEALLPLLEMKNEAARWDDYSTLIDFAGT